MAQNGGVSIAAYYVHWTVGHIPDKGANIDMILGPWGPEAGSEKRSAAALAYRLFDNGPSMMVIDAQDRPFSKISLLSRILRRDDVIGTALAKSIFDIADAILMKDKRVAELLGGHELIASNWWGRHTRYRIGYSVTF